ncbi:MAG: hypothetical protein LBN37_03940 [Bacteroidales bacterium]|jgi:hypothetical protein|nr:hypothetical protein [Bacteroidales bacterium]
MKKFLFLFIFLYAGTSVWAQAVPSQDENIPFLITFGKQSSITWGDDDFSQTFFFLVPETYTGMLFIRIFDADTGGKHDEAKGPFDTKMQYSLYGGKQAYSHPDAKNLDPIGNYKSGNLLTSKTVGVDPKLDDKWLTLGPFNPTEGEYIEDFKGYIFKLICDGISGDDGNLYRYFMSTSANENIAIEGGNAFAFEYSFRMHDDPNEVSHIYPFVDEKVITVEQSNFDWDNDGKIRVSSEARLELFCAVSGDGVWARSTFVLLEGEKGKSLNFTFLKKKPAVLNNNVVIYVRNQYGESLPFYTSPIGGVPKYKYKIQGQKAPKKN